MRILPLANDSSCLHIIVFKLKPQRIQDLWPTLRIRRVLHVKRYRCYRSYSETLPHFILLLVTTQIERVHKKIVHISVHNHLNNVCCCVAVLLGNTLPACYQPTSQLTTSGQTKRTLNTYSRLPGRGRQKGHLPF